MQKPSWKIRRKIIFGTLAFCAIIIAYVLWRGEDTNIAEVALNGSFMLAGAVIGSYVFGATWDDLNYMSKVENGSSTAQQYDDYTGFENQ